MNLPEHPLQHEMINDKKCFLMRSKNVLTSPELAEKHLWSNLLISSTCMVFSSRIEEHIFSLYHIFLKTYMHTKIKEVFSSRISENYILACKLLKCVHWNLMV